MEDKRLLDLLEKIKQNSITPQTALTYIKNMISTNLGFAEVDISRDTRKGFPEVVYCKNKSDEDILAISKELYKHNKKLLLTKVTEATATLLQAHFKVVQYYKNSGSLVIGKINKGCGKVTVVSAGTSDIPVAEEAAVTARVVGAHVETYWDIGVAGIHRLLSKIETLRTSRVIVAVAGMDGALPSVIAGLVSCPVIAVPTSVGYGAHLNGIAPLLTMLNSCAPGVTVVNIDNGFGAGYTAALINQIGE
ncbi:MAG: nickel pincer cofactor biosynthesis protein LarB [Spirochaetales bacterium]|nr:nickel pincer cofactor biosynthesis protein LarB [Spirochaetales bacterium]